MPIAIQQGMIMTKAEAADDQSDKFAHRGATRCTSSSFVRLRALSKSR
jgi:hypothetical protein